MAQDIGLNTKYHTEFWFTDVPASCRESVGSWQSVEIERILDFQGSQYWLCLNHRQHELRLRIKNLKGVIVSPRPWHTTVGVLCGESPSASICLTNHRQAHGNSNSIWFQTIENIRRALPDFDSRLFLRFKILFHLDSGGLLPKKGKKSLSQDLGRMLDESSYHDVEIKCGDRGFKAHRNVLSARSEVFSAMLQSDMVERKTGQVKIQDIEPEIFRHFLVYVYTGELPELSVDVAMQLYEAGDKYAMEDLKTDCAIFLSQSLKPEIACDILVLADRYRDQDLKDAVIAHMLEEKLPHRDDLWPELRDNHPSLTIEVLTCFYNNAHCSNKRPRIVPTSIETYNKRPKCVSEHEETFN